MERMRDIYFLRNSISCGKRYAAHLHATAEEIEKELEKDEAKLRELEKEIENENKGDDK